jgi:hypothetical protein
VFGNNVPAFVAGNPYGGGRSYYDEDGVQKDSGFFEFGSAAELDGFLERNPHCSAVKAEDEIY